jgi:hypothetical protein
MEKGYLTRKDKESVKVPFLFNPKELSIEKSNQYSEVNIPGLPSPIFQFVRGNARSVTMDLFFDTYEQGKDVRIDSDLHAPPVCIFIWGAFIFQCIIERVSKRFTMFLPEGVPVRATLSVTLKEYREVDVQVKEISLQSADLTKRWLVTQGDSLWSIAAKEYGNPGDWRLIAEANKIENPRTLTPGEELVVPLKES